MTIKIYSKIRPTKEYSKMYIKMLLEDFVSIYPLKTELIPDDIVEIQFCKQDSRGLPSIASIDINSCIKRQLHFKTYRDMLCYIQGFVDAD